MRSVFALAATTLVATALASGAFAAEFTKGTVKKVDAKAKKVTLIHEELKDLEMPAMTMVFRGKDDAMLQKLKEGASIKFVAERVEGKLTVTEIK
jgi:Cu/Ag efflux protein CusF